MIVEKTQWRAKNANNENNKYTALAECCKQYIKPAGAGQYHLIKEMRWQGELVEPGLYLFIMALHDFILKFFCE